MTNPNPEIGSTLVTAMAFAAALGSGVVGGVLLAFSTFVMAALARLPAQQGIAAMQSINITVINPVFMLTFLGTGAVCLGLIATQFLRRGETGTTLIIVAGLIYLVGCLGVTMVFNVPLNDELAAVQAHTQEAATIWSRYLANWTICNHVRTAAAIATAAALTVAIRNVSLFGLLR